MTIMKNLLILRQLYYGSNHYCCLQNGPLDDAIEAKRTDIIELLLIRGVVVPPSTLKKVIINMENE